MAQLHRSSSLRSFLASIVALSAVSACAEGTAPEFVVPGLTDGGSNVGDGGGSMDSGTTPTTPPTDGGTTDGSTVPPLDSGTGSVDSGTVTPTDSGTTPTDSGTTPRDAMIDDIDTGTIDTGPIVREDCGKLELIIRDFRDTHPDMEAFWGIWPATGIVQSQLGQDQKPVFATAAGQVTNASSFNQWYNDVTDVNVRVIREIELADVGGGTFRYRNLTFFPIDDDGFGNQGRAHNYHFTTEAHTTFEYRGGEVFNFRGDDDLWIFVNNRLALDLGGVHFPTDGAINFDQQASNLGISVGNTYPMDIFHAERRTSESNFEISTNIECLVSVPIN